MFPLFSFAQLWDSLGSGQSKQVRCLYADTIENILYAGGGFSHAGSVEVDGIAKWNGIKWDSLGTGVDKYDGHGVHTTANVLAITRYKGMIYAGGAFDSIGGIKSHGIARRNGTNWETIGVVSGGSVLNFYVQNNLLYVSGIFDSIGGIYSPGIAMWNGVNWLAFPPLDNDGACYINEVIYYKGELYVGGNFNATCGPNMADIARWDGAQWKPVNNGFSGAGTLVNSFAIYNNELYIGGYFFNGIDYGNCILIWDGNDWKKAGNGFNAQVADLIVYDGSLWAVGQFLYVNDIPVKCIAKWDGYEWCTFGSQFDNTISATAIMNNDLYIGGGFSSIDGIPINKVAKWIGGNYVDSCRNTTSIDEDNVVERLFVYPNPTSDYISINLSDLRNSKVEISIYDITGKIIFNESYANCTGKFTKSIDLDAYTSGLYLIKVNADESMFTAKIIKQ
jgi:hypothetical protein